jgi:hypothetical protein
MEHFVKEFKKILHRDDIKHELKQFIIPFIELILQDIYPYIYMSLIFVIISFLLILAIFILLVRNKYN